jgi:hypothetical protein
MQKQARKHYKQQQFCFFSLDRSDNHPSFSTLFTS